MTWRRTVLAPLTALSLAVPMLAAMQAPAAADVLDLSNFELRPNAYGTELRERADALPLEKATVTDIMNDLNRRDDEDPTGNGEACETGAVDKAVDIGQSVCFNDGDNATKQWFPQGVTTVADMQNDQEWGDGHQPILVSWYDKTNDDGIVKGVRISFMNRDTGAYRHVLLVYPRSNGDYDTVRVSMDPSHKNYDTSLHAGGILWYGNYLFVADTARGFRMFDMRRIYDLGRSKNGTTSGPNKVGLHGDMYHGYAYRYVMPQVGSWTRTAGTGEKCDSGDGSPNFSHVSLDRSGVNHLVAGEYCKAALNTNGRVAAWPIAGAFNGDGELITDTGYRWQADAAHKLPEPRIQGATRFDGRWYLSKSNGNNAGTLYTTEKATNSTETLSVADEKPLTIGPEDLSHWNTAGPSLGTLWTVAEHADKRMVYSVGLP